MKNNILIVSIPSNGSIQFLQNEKENTRVFVLSESQSPQTGQFNSYILTIIKDKMKNK